MMVMADMKPHIFAEKIRLLSHVKKINIVLNSSTNRKKILHLGIDWATQNGQVDITSAVTFQSNDGLGKTPGYSCPY